jgi:carboxypeptidase C (cathepsin A)
MPINLKGVAVGDGLVDPLNQYPAYPHYAYDNGLVSEVTYDAMLAADVACRDAIAVCVGNYTDVRSMPKEVWLACIAAWVECNYGEVVPVQLTGINLYDIRKPCSHLPLCYDFSIVENLLANASFKRLLGVPPDVSWSECNRLAELKLVFAGDWMLSFAFAVPELLAQNIPVLIYHGDKDYICNWYGGREWTKALAWPGQACFNAAPDTNWTVAGQVAGSYMTCKGLTLLRVSEAGHMVPMDQPVAALSMINSFMSGKWNA